MRVRVRVRARARVSHLDALSRLGRLGALDGLGTTLERGGVPPLTLAVLAANLHLVRVGVDLGTSDRKLRFHRSGSAWMAKAVKLAALGAAGSSSRGSGWALSEPASSWEY